MRRPFDSASTGVRQGNVAGFPAIWTVVEPVGTHANVVLAFADGAILLAGAMLLGFVAHNANDGTGHGSLQGKLYLSMAMRGKASVVRCAEFSTEPFGTAREFFPASHISPCFAVL
jgi:hypothetical protein